MMRLAALLLPVILLGGCQTLTGVPDLPGPEGAVDSEGFLCHDFDLLWETAKIQATRQGYRIDDDATTYRERRIVTSWKTELATTVNDGKRRRRYVDFVEVPGQKNTWKVRVAVVVQKNGSFEDPLNPTAAKWKEDFPDVEDAQRVAYMIESQFREFGPSPEFQNR